MALQAELLVREFIDPYQRQRGEHHHDALGEVEPPDALKISIEAQRSAHRERWRRSPPRPRLDEQVRQAPHGDEGIDQGS